MDIHRHAVLHRAVAVPSLLQARRVGEEACGEGLGDGHDVARAYRRDGDFDSVAEFGELVADVARAGEGALLEEVFAAPDVAEVAVDPLVPDVEEGEVVAAFPDGEAGAGAVGVDFLVLGAVEERGGFAEHGDDGEDFLDAAVVGGGEDRFGEHGVGGEFGHLPPDFGEVAAVVEGAEGIELFEGADEGVGGWGVHEVEFDEVVDAEGFEEEDDGVEVGALDFGGGVLVEFVVVREFGV